MNYEERAIRFSCDGAQMVGILSLPAQAASRGVLIMVGGPQYRVGSHRQFVLLARYLASHGIAAMRFDYRGMGDSEGEERAFEDVQDDVRHAIDRFLAEAPEVKEIVIWGLCDAASAAIFYACQDARVSGLVLLNPWVRTEAGIAKAFLKHYYLARLRDRHFWYKLVGGRVNLWATAKSGLNLIRKSAARTGKSTDASPSEPVGDAEDCSTLPDRMWEALNRFKGKILIVLSGSDLTAREFSGLVTTSPKWRRLIGSPSVSRTDLPSANHTFSRQAWRDEVAMRTKDWLMTW